MRRICGVRDKRQPSRAQLGNWTWLTRTSWLSMCMLDFGHIGRHDWDDGP